jgi:hypothetical protein
MGGPPRKGWVPRSRLLLAKAGQSRSQVSPIADNALVALVGNRKCAVSGSPHYLRALWKPYNLTYGEISKTTPHP